MTITSFIFSPIGKPPELDPGNEKPPAIFAIAGGLNVGRLRLSHPVVK